MPPDIVGVARRSPPRVKKRTPWHPQPDGAAPTDRAGQREWFSDRVFIESQAGHARSGYGVSLVLHICAVIPLLAFLMTRPDELLITAFSPRVDMPAFLAPPPNVPAPEPIASPTAERPQSKTRAVVPAAAAPPSKVDGTAAPVDVPTGITPETGDENRVSGVEGGVPGGVAGGVVGGVGNVPSAPGPPGPTILRAGTDVKPPRKIKDVKPVYPAIASSTRAQGAVLVEAVIGTDGRVQDVKVLHSVALLDQAAVDAVRQWQYEPSTLNGVPIVVIMTVVVTFALQ